MSDGGTVRNGRILLIGPAGDQGDIAWILGIGGGEPGETFTLENAEHVEEGRTRISAAVAEGRPYAMAFIDIRDPVRNEDLQAIGALWSVDSELQIVICTDRSGEALSQIEQVLGKSDRWLMLRRPYEEVEVRRLAAALAVKWGLGRRAAMKLGELESLVGCRTRELEEARQQDRQRLDELENTIDRRTAELRRAATHDGLTGLPNRTLLHDRLAQALQLTQRNPEFAVAVLFIDFDRFKVVNDSLGHQAGDKLLSAIAQRLEAVVRGTDTVAQGGPWGSTAARLGGDEFCVLLTGLKRLDEAPRIADRILRVIEEPFPLAGRQVQSTASIGIAVSGIGYERAEDMVRDADNAMYRAKAQGGGRFVVFDRVMHAEAMERLLIENDLRQAIDREQLRTHFQPVVSLTSGDLLGVEALVRWHRPGRGLTQPLDFIRIAEETGYIERLGLWVLEDACGRLAAWKRDHPRARDMTVSVNVSRRQFDAPDFSGKVADILSRTGLAAEALILEITESMLMENVGEMGVALRALNDLGVRIYLDDFGTGYSSLNVVHTFPISGLKIDRSFISRSESRRRFAAMIQTMMSMVQNLELEAVAEGVETLEHVALLQSLGCSKAQGYLFSPPISGEAIEAMLSQPMRNWGIGTGSVARRAIH